MCIFKSVDKKTTSNINSLNAKFAILAFNELSEFKWINQLPFPLKSSQNYNFSDGFRGNKINLFKFV